MIEKINSFEKNCINYRLSKETIDNVFNIDINSMDFEEAEKDANSQEYTIMRQLLQDKTIFFCNFGNFLSQKKLTDFKLVILNDVYISHKALKQRYKYFQFLFK